MPSKILAPLYLSLGCSPDPAVDVETCVVPAKNAITESLDNSHNTRHELKTCHCMQEFFKCPHRRETERSEKLSLEAEEQTQHFGDGEDDLTVGDIQQELLPHPLSPFLTAFCLTGGTKAAGFAGKHQKALFPTVWTPDAGKPTHRVATVEILLNNILDNRPEIAVLLLETIIIFPKEPLKGIKEHTIKNRVFRMSLPVDTCHGSRDVSGNRPKN